MKRLLVGLFAFALLAIVFVFVLAPAAGSQYRLWRDARSIRDYRRAVGALDTLECGTLLAEARRYNGQLREAALRDVFDAAYPWDDDDAGAEVLDVTGSGVIAVLEIPKLGLNMPICRGLSHAALARGVVHLAGSSLPVGGEGTHCLLAGQAGGRFAELLDGIDRLIPGDCFYIQALQDTLIYEVTQLEELDPEALAAQPLDAQADLCTLMTARKGGDGRWLVHARRIRRREVPLDDDTQVLPGWAARLIFAVPLALAGWILLMLVEGLRRAVKKRRLRRMKL